MTLRSRGSLVWLGMILAGLMLGAYVLVAWPDSSPRVSAQPQPVRATASVSSPEPELAGVAGAIYPDELYGIFEAGTSPALDALIGGLPPAVLG